MKMKSEKQETMNMENHSVLLLNYPEANYRQYKG